MMDCWMRIFGFGLAVGFLSSAMATSSSTLLRCYCNLAECGADRTCKSRTGCFQELPHYNIPQPLYRRLKGAVTPVPSTDLRYGCLELWPEDSAPFQCTEPGIRKSPPIISDSRRRQQSNGDSNMDDDEDDPIGHRGGGGGNKAHGRRRSSATNRFSGGHHSNKFDTRRWSAYDVPLRCCTSDMCNRRAHVPQPQPPPPITIRPWEIRQSSMNDVPELLSSSSPSSTVTAAAGTPWWFTSTMIFVPIVGGIIFFLLVVIGCWILHYGHSNPFARGCRRTKLMTTTTTTSTAAHSISIPPATRYYFLTSPTSTANIVVRNTVSDGGGEENSTTTTVIDKALIKPCKCLVVEARGDSSSPTTGGRCVHILPIFFSKYQHQHHPGGSTEVATVVRSSQR